MPERKSQQMLEMPEETVPQKFKNLRTIARAAAYNPEFRAYIFNRAHVAGYNDMRRDAPAFFRLLAGDFIYTPEVGEFYQYPLHFARAPLGDCDDQTIYLAAAADVIFTSGGTEANNLALVGGCRGHLFVSAVEHPSVIESARCLRERGFEVTFLPVDGMGVVGKAVKAAGGELVGAVATDGFEYDASEGEEDGKFIGLPLDEDNQSDQSADRIAAWVSELKKSFT